MIWAAVSLCEALFVQVNKRPRDRLSGRSLDGATQVYPVSPTQPGCIDFTKLQRPASLQFMIAPFFTPTAVLHANRLAVRRSRTRSHISSILLRYL